MYGAVPPIAGRRSHHYLHWNWSFMAERLIDVIWRDTDPVRLGIPVGLPRVVVALVLALCTGCFGGSSPGGTTADQVAERFGACEVSGEGGDLWEFLSDVSGWIHVAKVLEADRDGEGERKTLPSVLVDTSGTERTAHVHVSFWPGIDWGLKHDAQVWLAVADPTGLEYKDLVAYVVVIAADSSVFFPGNCQEESLRQPLIERFGSRYSGVVRAAVGKTGRPLRSIFGLAPS